MEEDQKPGFVQKLRDAANSSHAAPLWAEWRRGLKELQSALVDPSSNVANTSAEAGAIASPTQALVTEEMVGEKQYLSMLDQHAARAVYGKEQEQDRGHER